MGRARVVHLLEIQTQSCNIIPSLWKTKLRRTNLQICCQNCTGVMRGFCIITDITQGLPQRNESFECSQTDGSRQYGPCPVREVRPDGSALEHEHEVARKSVRGVSRILIDMRNPLDIFLTCTWVCMGLDGSACSECPPVVTSQISHL